MTFERELNAATTNLPPTVRIWLERAFRSGWFAIGPDAYDGDGRMCPIVAAATLAGAWGPHGLRLGNPHWGSEAGPTPAVEDFAAYFDLCAEQLGTEGAIAVVIEALAGQATRRASASSSR